MTTTTTDFFEALQQLPDKSAAKTVTDYVEETRQTNIARIKEVFATKEDLQKIKVELIEKINDASDKLNSRLTTLIITLVLMILGLYATILLK
jgi:hypothetical protein